MAPGQQPEELGIGRLFWVMSDAIVAADVATQRIVLWNPAAERLFGYSADEAIGMALEVLVPASTRSAHHAGLERYRDGGAPVLVGGDPVEVAALTRTGEERSIALTLSDVSTSADRRHVVAVIRDVTEIRQAQLDLQRVNEAMQDFVAAASHDLRTPLASILGLASTLVSPTNSPTRNARTSSRRSCAVRIGRPDSSTTSSRSPRSTRTPSWSRPSRSRSRKRPPMRSASSEWTSRSRCRANSSHRSTPTTSSESW